MRRVLITGAGRGLGLALARAALARGDLVLATARDPSALRPLQGARLLPLDVACPASIAEAAAEVARQVDGLDLLLNNAAIHAYSPEVRPDQRNLELGSLEPEGLLRMLRVNALGPLLLTQALAPLLARGARPLVLNLSSRKGALAHPQPGGNYGYRVSKAALNMAGRTLAEDLRPLGVAVVQVHPGRVRTAMGGPDAPLTPEEAARALLALSDRLGLADTGRFLCHDGAEHPW